MGKRYWETKLFLDKAQWWGADKIEKWQSERLQEIVRYAYDNVPGYHTLLDESKVSPRDITCLSDIKLLPFVTKEVLRDNLSDFTSKSISKEKLFYGTTAGSTGIPFGFYQTELNDQIENAFMHSGWERKGWRLGDLSGVLKGAFIGSQRQFWKFDRNRNDLLLSSYYLNEDTYSQYVAKIRDYNPTHLKAYPSTATILADLVLANDEVGKLNFNLLLLGSENIYPWQKEKLLKAFPGSKLFAWYGQAEQVILSAMCGTSDKYHIWPFYGISELINAGGVETDIGETGEMLGTSFWNYVTPFIRYRTLDMARRGSNFCEQCQRKFQLLENIDGRLQEMIVTGKRRYISMTAMNMHSEVFDNLKQFQFYQDKPGIVVFKMIKKSSFTNQDVHLIRRELLKKLGEDIELKFAFVKNIPRSPRGKHRFLEQRLKLKYGE